MAAMESQICPRRLHSLADSLCALLSTACNAGETAPFTGRSEEPSALQRTLMDQAGDTTSRVSEQCTEAASGSLLAEPLNCVPKCDAHKESLSRSWLNCRVEHGTG